MDDTGAPIAVDVEKAIWAGTISNPALIAVWEVINSDSSLKACYYAKGIKIPKLC